ncbi:hypothetical protein [Stenotrophomonas sp. AS1]|uniref:hypothetical protein n=1 Tax=Stenotrophomonas sp. AS1 TaxID=3029188 RepID=UPI003B8026EA
MNYIQPNDRMYALERAVHLAEQQGVGALSTSDGARSYIAHFFSREMRRHDFATYIGSELAADFACALAQHLSTRQPGAKEPRAWLIHWSHQGGHPEATTSKSRVDAVGSLTTPPRIEPLYDAPPAQGIDLHRLVPPEWISEQIGGQMDDLTLGQAWRQGFNQCRARVLLLVEQAAGFPSDQQRDAAPGVGNG